MEDQEDNTTDIYVIHVNGKNYGPINSEGIKSFLEQKKILPTHFLYNFEQKCWQMIGELKEFAPYLPQRPTIPFEKPSFYFLVDQKISGPITRSFLLKMIKSGELSPFDYIFIEGGSDWVCLKNTDLILDVLPSPPLVVPRLAFNKRDSGLVEAKEGAGDLEKRVDQGVVNSLEKFREGKFGKEIFQKENQQASPVSHPDKQISKPDKSVTRSNVFEIKNNPIWKVMKEEKEYGPFRFLEVVKLIQDGLIGHTNEVKNISEPDFAWKKIKDTPEFNANILRKIVNENGQMVEKILMARKYKRSSYLGPAVIILNGKELQGTCSSISEGGCFVEMMPRDLSLGDEVVIKILPGTVPLYFETKGKVVSIMERNPRGIGVKFLDLEEKMAEQIRKFVDRYNENLRR